MGYGNYTAQDWDKLRNSRGINDTDNVNEIFRQRECNPKFNPKFINRREVRDSEDHPESLPIILGLDVTASMGYLAKKVAQETLNETMMKLFSTNAVKDPAIMFAAYGDYYDEAPLQVTQFESDIRIAEQLLELWLEEHGNSMVCPYLLWYFATHHVEADNYIKRQKKGFIFTIGDDAELRKDREFRPDYANNRLKVSLSDYVFNENANLDIKAVLKDATKQYEIFHIVLSDGYVPVSFTKALPGHVLRISPTELDALPEIMISIIQLVNGNKMDDVLKQWEQLKQPIIKKALKSLKLKTQNGEMTF